MGEESIKRAERPKLEKERTVDRTSGTGGGSGNKADKKIKEALADQLKKKGISVDPAKVSKEYLMELASNSGVDMASVSSENSVSDQKKTSIDNEYEKNLEANSKKNEYGDLPSATYSMEGKDVAQFEKEQKLLKDVKEKIAKAEAVQEDNKKEEPKDKTTKPIDGVRRRRELAQYEYDKKHPQQAMAREEARAAFKKDEDEKKAKDASRRSKTSDSSGRKSMMQSDNSSIWLIHRK